jgi:hypothetical protein
VREAALDNPALATQARAVCGAASGDQWLDAASSQQPPVLVVVIATVGEQRPRLLAWPARLASDRPGVQVVQQRQQLGDVVALTARQGNSQRDTAGVDQEMML